MLRKTLFLASLLTAFNLVLAQAGPPEPLSDDFDWLQFKNGEWLKGELKDVQDGSVVFESDQLDTLNLDLDDIQAIHSKKTQFILMKDKSSAAGSLRIEGDAVVVTSASGEKTFTRDGLRSIIPGEQSEWNYWSVRLSGGATVRSGNVNQNDFTWFLGVTRRSPNARTSFDYNGSLSTVSGNQVANNHRALLTHDIFLTPKFYVRVPYAEYFADRFQNTEYRITAGAGVGYDIYDRHGVEWSAFAGGAWQTTEYVDVIPGTAESLDTAAALFGTRFSWEITSKIDFLASYQLTMPVPETATYNHHAEIKFVIDALFDLDLEVSAVWDRVNQPVARADGTVPVPDDFRLYFGVAWEL